VSQFKLKVTAVLLLVLLIFTLSGCQKRLPNQPLNYQAQLFKAAQSFLGKKEPLKVLGKTKTPSGLIYELKAKNGAYLNVRAKDLTVTFANFGEIKKRSLTPVFNYQQAKAKALSWAKKKPIFQQFKLVKEQVNFDWPKPTYYTVIWQAKKLKSPDKFGKVTVDLVTGKVVSYGVGDPKWSMFCLPVKVEANQKKGLPAKKLLQPGI